MIFMEYAKALDIVCNALKFGIDQSLDPIRKLCAALGTPLQKYDCIQVAGTNGKSSVCRMIAALLHASGKRVGLYTSPHLVNYPERIEINGKVISKQLFADGIEAAVCAGKAAGVQATEFELLTAAALWAFARENVDVAVLECGLGGRWDATSVCSPKVAVITGIGLDHTKILGNTVEKIAAEKAAIIKPGSVAVLAPNLTAQEVFVAQARDCGVRIIDVDANKSLPLKNALKHMPRYQLSNAATALTATETFLGARIDEKLARTAFAKLTIPGRFEILQMQPMLIIDAAHNPQSAHVLVQEIIERKLDCTLVLGVLQDKDCAGIVNEFTGHFKKIVVTCSTSPRALPAENLASLVRDCGVEPIIAASVKDALVLAKKENVLATGSITIAGEVKRIYLNRREVFDDCTNS